MPKLFIGTKYYPFRKINVMYKKRALLQKQNKKDQENYVFYPKEYPIIDLYIEMQYL